MATTIRPPLRLCALALGLLAGLAAGEAAPRPGLRVICAWNMELNDAVIPDLLDQAKGLGFNAIAWTHGRGDAVVVAACRARTMRAFKVIEPLGVKKIRRPDALLQSLRPDELALPGAVKIPDGHPYQWGGAPAPGSREVFMDPLACPNDPAVRPATLAQVDAAAALGFDGVCWDMIGYRNYASCQCALCSERLKQWRERNPAPPDAAFFAEQLVGLYADLAATIRQRHPGLSLMCHVYPEFTPDPLYGRRLAVDWCGVTVSWFFPPHWPMEAVRTRIAETVRPPDPPSRALGMPMIGFYRGANAKSAQRLRDELLAVCSAGANAVMVAELGDLLATPEAAATVRGVLAGGD